MPLLEHAVRRALGAPEVSHVIVVAPASHVREAGAIASRSDRPEDVDVVAGGAERTPSVAAGLAALRPGDGIVLVHDAARALAPAELFSRLVREVRSGHPAVVPGLPVTDTIKAVDARGRVTGTPDRLTLRAIQTPQAFLREVLEHAHASGARPPTTPPSSSGSAATSGWSMATRWPSRSRPRTTWPWPSDTSPTPDQPTRTAGA